MKQSHQSLYTAAQVREIDRIAIQELGISGVTLMRRAAQACVDVILEAWPDIEQATVYCGSGNNAGDGYIIAGMLASKNFSVLVYEVGNAQSLSADALAARKYCLESEATIQVYIPSDIATEGVVDDKSELIIDAMLGTGVSGELRRNFKSAISHINQCRCPVLAVDIPSGLDADTGIAMSVAIQADATVTFIARKRGLYTQQGPDHCGQLYFSDLQIPVEIGASVAKLAAIPRTLLLEYDELISNFGERPRLAHKHDFGHVVVVGGNKGMGGAIAMSAEAALRTGAGLVSVVTHEFHAANLLMRCPELMVQGVEGEFHENHLSDQTSQNINTLLSRATVIVLGPGLGRNAWSREIYNLVMAFVGNDGNGPGLVVDADGLHFLAETPHRYDGWVLTPHLGEARKLLGHVNTHLNTQALRFEDRFAVLSALNSEYGGVNLLKGVGTIIQKQDHLALCPYGNPGMSTAGMGDVLSGVVAGLIAQGCDQEFATRLGVVVHALAADRCVYKDGERGLLATDILVEVRRLLNAR